MGSEAVYVDKEYIPDGFTFKEPSKLNKIEAYDRLKFWYDRQENPRVKKVFRFSRIRGPTGDPELPADGLKRKKPVGKRPIPELQKTRGGKDPESDRESSDSSSSSSEEQEEEDREQEEEEEDHPPPKKRLRPDLKPPKPLPFAAIPVRPRGQPGPRTGPQIERPTTRQQKRKAQEEEEEEVVPKKKAKRSAEVTKVGPPRGQKKEKPLKGQGKAKV
jgi:hypothetical protein